MVESDEEQLEQLKNWWDENGTSLIFTVVIALGGVFGFRAWETSVQQTGEAASTVYEDLVAAVANLESNEAAMRATADSLFSRLKDEYGGTTYAVFGAMHMAKLAVDSDDLATARAELEWALEKVDDASLETMLRVRLARVLNAKGDATAAMTVLVNYEPPAGQIASVEEALGDTYHSLGDMTRARAAYQKALDHLEDGVSKPILEIKLADIPVTQPMDEGA